MKKLLLILAAILLLISCSPNPDVHKTPENITLVSYAKNRLQNQVEITDQRNGEKAVLKDPNEIAAFVNMLKGVELTKSDDQEVRKGDSTFSIRSKKGPFLLSANQVMVDGVRYNAKRPLPVEQITETFFIKPHEASP